MNSYITYTSIYSVLEDIHSMVDSPDWDEDKMLDWALKGLRKLNLPAKYEDHVVFLPVAGHIGILPTDIKYINQIFYKITNTTTATDEQLNEIAEALGIVDTAAFYKHMKNPLGVPTQVLIASEFYKGFKPLRRDSGSFGTNPCYLDKIPHRWNGPTTPCSTSRADRYVIHNKTSIQTTFKTGCIILSYKRYVKDEEGLDLVPDNEDLKEALFHFCMYRWWMSRNIYKEEGAERRMLFHLQQYKELGRKAAGNLNSPDTDTMENIKDTRDRLVPRSNFYDSGFSRLSNRENIGF